MSVHVVSTSAPHDVKLTAEQKLYWLNALQVVGDWSVHDDGDGRLFYYNHTTNLSQWEVPEGLASLETEFMMKLMLQNAVARSGSWTAHDAGNGTMYYFNANTRVSVWERPSEWGEAEAVATAAVEAREREEVVEEKREKEKEKEKVKTRKKEMKERKKNKKKLEKQAELKKVEAEKEATEIKVVQEEEPLTAEELKEEEEHHARKQKCIEQFCAMLCDKNIMPFCKWSVALPQIAGDPRFLGVPSMDERRAIFEHFVEHRREDLKVEKKSKLKHAKQVFMQLLREQFQVESWEANTPLSVFLSTLQDNLGPERYNEVQNDALAILTLSAQEKLYSKAVAEYKSEALKRDGEQLRLTKFLEDKLATNDNLITLQWESDDVQELLREFYNSAFLSGMLLSEQKQRQVFDELMARKVYDRTLEYKAVDEKQSDGLPRQDHSTDKAQSQPVAISRAWKAISQPKKQSASLAIFVTLAFSGAIVSEIF
ncbi:unnamed protein product [Peronospora belbahrii]|uniref:WW domain-containing protein n=1 Tax=Peronospora belbahrii TaxID=622444 RepID=A0AAU9KQY4_9STRA|nr:unnamed protein product [Peronospora belbahrii]CAH0520040.1 unnamed protein product [Peronospora belbahrii]